MKNGLDFLSARGMKTPSHLQEIVDALSKTGIYEIDETEYAKIGFLLMEVSNGNKEALKKVSDFIQMEHQRLHNATDRHSSFVKDVASWFQYARFWTIRSTNKIEEKDMV